MNRHNDEWYNTELKRRLEQVESMEVVRMRKKDYVISVLLIALCFLLVIGGAFL